MDMRPNLKFRSREDSSTLMNKTLKKGQSLTESPPHTEPPLTPPPSLPQPQGGDNLSPEEKALISSLSKVFNSHSSRPNKILVRIDHTKPDGGEVPDAGGRLVRVEAVWVEGENVQPSRKQVEIAIQPQGKPPKQLRQSQCAVLLGESSCGTEEIQRVRPPSFNNPDQIRRILSFSRQIAITYVPEQSPTNQSGLRSNGNFSKFKCKPSPSFSDRSLLSEQQNVPSVEPPFIKLHDLQLFLTKDEIKQRRIKELLHANERIHLAERAVKAEMGGMVEEMGRVRAEAEREGRRWGEEVERGRVEVGRVREELEERNRQLVKIRGLNDLYLKENNELKARLKEQMKLMQEMRREIANGRDYEYREKGEGRPTPQPSIANIVSSSTMPAQQVPKTVQLVMNPYQLNAGGAESRLKMCRSQETLRIEPHQDYMLGEVDMPIVAEGCEPSSKSQKSYGIRKNIPPNVLPPTKNLVRVAKINDTSIHNIKDEPREPRDNKSISSYTSNLSGKSLSQRIGHIVKPKVKEGKPGVLVDYMLDGPPPGQTRVEVPLPRFQLGRK